MGYYTNYKLTVKDKDGTEIDNSLCPDFDKDDLYSGSLSIQQVIDWHDSMKWYEHHEEMIEISKTYPDYVFILDGQGEESGDVWRKFYKNGKSYEWKLEYSIPDFNAKKLK